MLKTLPELIAEASTGLRVVNAASARNEIRENQGILIDVREPPEVQAHPSQGAINIPRGVLEVKMPELYPDENQPIYLHCATGGRARLGAEQLERIGYRRVTAISCGVETVCEVFDE
ncbi:MAG: rhodanese-like domain-containing protein [Xanthomonadales bacterium]|nr:rhodanese-like domain-containing protein [Xanthomonadales bacterium]